MDVHVVGVGLHEASANLSHERLEEVAFATSSAALRDASMERSAIEGLTLAASDELDGRPISSMLLLGPAGGMLTEEIRVTDSGLSAICLAAARIMAGEQQTSLVVSWCKSSKIATSDVMRFRADPFYLRPLGVDADLTDALWAQAVSQSLQIPEREVGARVSAAQQRALANPRGLQNPAKSPEEISVSPYTMTPVKEAHRAPLTDGAAALVLVSGTYLRTHGLTSLARLAGVGWSSESYTLGIERLLSTRALDRAWSDALRMAGLTTPNDLDVIELDAPTGFHEAAFARQLRLDPAIPISPSGGVWAQNPFFCMGLVNAVEAVLQVSARSGPTQIDGARWAAAHGVHGFAAQGHVVAVFEGGVA